MVNGEIGRADLRAFLGVGYSVGGVCGYYHIFDAESWRGLTRARRSVIRWTGPIMWLPGGEHAGYFTALVRGIAPHRPGDIDRRLSINIMPCKAL